MSDADENIMNSNVIARRRRNVHALRAKTVPTGCLCHWQWLEYWRLVSRAVACPLHGNWIWRR